MDDEPHQALKALKEGGGERSFRWLRMAHASGEVLVPNNVSVEERHPDMSPGTEGIIPPTPPPAPLDMMAGESGSEEGSPPAGVPRSGGIGAPDLGRGPNAAEKYRDRRRRQAAAKRRGPFIRDTATDSELPARARSAAYRILNSEIHEETLSAHHLIAFRKYVDGLIEGVKV